MAKGRRNRELRKYAAELMVVEPKFAASLLNAPSARTVKSLARKFRKGKLRVVKER